MAYRTVPLSPLAQFFYGYVNQDFADLYPSAWAGVEDFVASEPLEDRTAARTELVELLQQCTTEQELSRAVDRVGLGFHPPGAGDTYRGWLEKVETYLREHED